MPKSVFAIKRRGNNQSLKCAIVTLPQYVMKICIIYAWSGSHLVTNWLFSDLPR
jgi:hypothetical protein